MVVPWAKLGKLSLDDLFRMSLPTGSQASMAILVALLICRQSWQRSIMVSLLLGRLVLLAFRWRLTPLRRSILL